MSKILREIRDTLTGMVAVKKKSVNSGLMTISSNETRAERDPYMQELEVKAEFGTKVYFLPGQKNEAIDNIYHSLRHEIYGDFIKELRGLQRAYFNDDRIEFEARMRDLIRLTEG